MKYEGAVEVGSWVAALLGTCRGLSLMLCLCFALLASLESISPLGPRNRPRAVALGVRLLSSPCFCPISGPQMMSQSGRWG